jgi:hypothetical protein
MSHIRALSFFVVLLLSCLPAVFGAQETIDFEAFEEGEIVSQVSSREGSGPILVEGSNERFAPGTNAAVIYDSSCPESGLPEDCSGQDADLGTPNEGFGGPGWGSAGAPSGLYPNSVPLGNVLIVAEDLEDADGDGAVDDPDDEGALRNSSLTFDLSAIAPVTMHSLSILEIRYGGEPSTIELLDADGNLLGGSPYVLPSTDGNGVVADYGLDDTEGVHRMVVRLQGSGAVDNIVFSPEGAKVDIETSTNGSGADQVDGDDIPWIPEGQPVEWTYLVTNAGTVPLTEIEVSDNQEVAVSCPRDQLEPGESMECSASGISLDLMLAVLGIPTVRGRCKSGVDRPLYQNTGSVSARGPLGLVVVDSDRSHYCSDPARPAIHVRKGEKGPDTQMLPSGSDATFEVVVWNSGTEHLRDVKVADVLSPDCNREFDRLRAGKSVSYTCSAPGLSTGGANVDGCRFINEVVATGRAGSESVTDSDTSTVELAGLTIDTSFMGSSTESASFEIVVTNNGCDLDGVEVTDSQAPDCERDLGRLAAGDSRNYTCSKPHESETCAEGRSGDVVVSSCDTATLELPEGGDDAADGGEPGAGAAGDGEGLGAAGGPLLLVLLVLLVGGGLFAWNRMKAG